PTTSAPGSRRSRARRSSGPARALALAQLAAPGLKPAALKSDKGYYVNYPIRRGARSTVGSGHRAATLTRSLQRRGQSDAGLHGRLLLAHAQDLAGHRVEAAGGAAH